jgi:tyrosyl-tRNA synthetase
VGTLPVPMIRDPDLHRLLAPLARTVDTVTPEADLLRKLRSGRRLRVKFGIDPTATSVHIGNGIPLWNLRRFQDLGHQAVLIIGDATALVGDPSGKDKTRPMLTPEQVAANTTTWLDQIGKIVDLGRAEVRHNRKWFAPMPFFEVLRLADRMTVQQMLERDSFEKRFREETPISIREFLYCLMQGWDSVQVKADVELGGTDQTFNLNVGRRLMEQEGLEPQVCVVSPLLEGVDGQAKMSKSLGNSIGLSDAPKEQLGLCMRISDELLPKYLRLATPLSDAEIDALLAPGTNPRDAKLALGEEVVARYHGREAGRRERAEFLRVFSERQRPAEMPTVAVPAGGVGILDLLVLSGFAPSKGEARRLVGQGAVALDDRIVAEITERVAPKGGEVLRVGPRKFARLAPA